MQDEYLPIGYKIGGHYEIIEVLGDDEFEIVYIVKDIHRLDTLFILKELFIKEYSFRDDEKGVYILEKSKNSFEKTKKNVISEVNLFIEKGNRNSIRTYGYFEENNTIYTILEFINNRNLRDYLKITLKNNIEEIKPKVEIKKDKVKKDEIKQDIKEQEEKPKSYLYLKMLIASIIIFAILGVYAFNMIEEDKNKPKKVTVASSTTKKAVIPHPTLIDRTSQKEEVETDIPKNKNTNSTRYIPVENEGEKEEPKQEEKKIEIDAGVPAEEIIEVDQDEDEEPPIPAPKDNIEVVYVPPKKRVFTNSDVSLGTRVTNTDDIGPKFNRKNIQRFLNSFVASTEGNSIDKILSHYDTKVDRYFSLYGATHKNIYRDKVRYNRKWIHRDFELLDFEILNISKINSTEYCDLRMRTKWSVSTNSGRTASGTSRVFMVLKRTPNGFKVKTIYSF